MSDLYAHVDKQGRQLHVRTNIDTVSWEDLPDVLAAIGAHAGADVVPLRKAVFKRDKPPEDGRWPELHRLVRAARDDFMRWADHLVETLVAMFGPPSALNENDYQRLQRTYTDYQIALTGRLAGHVHEGQEGIDGARRRGLVVEGVSGSDKPSLVELAYRVGRDQPVLRAHELPVVTEPAKMREITERALSRPLTEKDKAALDYAKRNAAVYMRKPARQACTAADRVLSVRERAIMAEQLGQAVRMDLDAGTLARNLRGAVKGTSLTNDMDRVARTELTFAHGWGGYMALKSQAEAAGIDDPKVYKIVSNTACRDCKRIWGTPGNLQHYRLSYIEQREAEGANFGLPRKEWGPVIGAVHPNCTEGPLALYDERMQEALDRAAARIMGR